MKWYFKLLLLLIVALPIGAAIAVVGSKPTYLLIGYDNSVLETNLKFVLVLSLILGALGLVVCYSLYKTLFYTRKFLAWKRDRKIRYAEFQTRAGALALAEGKWQQAEQQFRSALSNQQEQLVAYLGAARAANNLGRHSDRNQYLESAKSHINGADLAANITLAELQLESGQLNDALTLINNLRSKFPSQPYLMNLQLQVYSRLKDWGALIKLLPQLKKHKVLSQSELLDLEKKSYVKHFQVLTREKMLNVNDENRSGYVNDLIRLWEERPGSLKQDAEVLKVFIGGIKLLGADDKAEAILAKHLGEIWSSDLITLYGKLECEVENQLAKARKWLASHPDDEMLLLALGRISLRAGDKASARKYFEDSLAIHKSYDASQELGKLLAAEGEYEKSNEYLLLSMA